MNLNGVHITWLKNKGIIKKKIKFRKKLLMVN